MPLVFDLGKVKDINEIKIKDRTSLIKIQKMLNSYGFIIRLECSRIIKNKNCRGRVRRISGKLKCGKCKSIWELESVSGNSINKSFDKKNRRSNRKRTLQKAIK